ncbi:hypothetical protein A1359_06950 [Methylomonas lenta]|uniref:Uncharacterized protein n=1 Tax=Methylomonas lenta TaxID=980561 RepID=A0A177NH19_9GAMM|nr:hypothetical protein [Methylomonas lenta]OAI16924.1 hypothetical protein A1359_06950 [Methylomonas lenta]
MTLWQKSRYVFAIIAQGVGIVWLMMAIYFIAKYYRDTENPLRHEYWFAVWIGIIYSTGFCLSSALLAVTVKNAIPRVAFRLLTVPALIIGLLLLIIYLGSMAYGIMVRT